jgi:23S rRNA (uracil1939-C5)-methyltransferase
MSDAETLDIVALGAQGDGIAETGQGPRYVPFALPGERVRVPDGGLPEILSTPSPDRIAPVCKHFGVCGGCVAQHMSASLYAEWKRNIVVEAFRQRGLEPEIAALQPVPLASRRRAVLTARRTGNDIVLGYHRRASHDGFLMEECPVLLPDIVRQLPGLRALAAVLPGREARITALHTPAGLDVSVEAEVRRTPAIAAQLARIADRHRFARIAMGGDTVVQRASPALSLGGVSLVPPPGVFLQAVQHAEATMVFYIRDAIGKAKRVADLFCGVGAFTLALAQSARLLAMDSDARAIAALDDAVRHAQGLKPVEARVRDLFRDPLSPLELQGFDAVVFDPPRAGAKAQAEALAKSRIPTVVAVSCNPATLARDARALVDGGYRIDSIVPIDQFLYSAHVEVVATFRC